jgi:ABC-type cobalt transport system substrate-binding protein
MLMGAIARSIGALVVGIMVGGVKTLRGNAPSVAEDIVLLGITSGIHYFVPEDNKNVIDALGGAESATSAILATDIANYMQIAKQVWVPASQEAYPG